VGGGGSAEGWSLAVGAIVGGGGQDAMVVDRHRWQRRRHLRVVADAVGVGKWQKSVTSWCPVIWLTEMRATCPVAKQMSYYDMKLKIEALLSLEPAHIAAHLGATLQAMLAGRVDEGGAPASREPSTLWGEAGRRGVG
jgi:hypothetical protein